MKFSTTVVIAFVAFIIIILSTVCGCSRYVPYSADTIFSKEYPYEGFTSTHHATEYSTANGNAAVDSYKSFLIGADADSCKKIYGFDGLYCKPFVADSKIDLFSDTKGSTSCVGSSSGLTNSQGGLCLSDAQKQLLVTRGGNQSGAQSQIGH